ncbi:MAG: hypothetical protein K0Q48_3601, partial [Bacillota bacterium]|nr:hypothetical protein [Bacillota bacterium]
MSLFDSMMLNNNGKNQKQNSAKKNVKSSGVSDRETF